jgi:DNA repair exonuclease SbcCD ATPase subunit
MEEISSSIKCGNCKNSLDTPVFLPCGDSICEKHTAESKETILCRTCGVEHAVPENVGFPLNKGLARIIKAQIAEIDFGDEHKEAKQSCENFDDLLTKIDVFLKDSYTLTYESIVQLKNVVQLKGEEEIVRIKKNMHRIIDDLDEYNNECKKSFKQSDYLKKLENFTQEKEEARQEMEKWLAKLNELKSDWREYERIKNESEKAIIRFENKLIDFIPKRLEKFKHEIEKDFGEFEIDSPFHIRYK